MHFTTTVVVRLPQTQEDAKTDKEVFEYRESLKKQLKCASGIGSIVGLECHISELGNYTSAFGRAVVEAVENCLEPYCECTENPKYLEFDDMTEEITQTYNFGTEDYVKMPNGSLVSIYSCEFSSKYAAKDGLVYEKNWGSLKSLKRTKRAKKIKVLKDYPLSKIYKTFEEFAEKHYGADFDEETQRYGRYFNFNSFWDWYRIGGRWPKTFLVKEDCAEFSIGNVDNVEILKDAPAGYKWTSAARKRDICWDAIVSYRKQKAIDLYNDCKEYFAKGEVPKDSWLRISENGVYSYMNEAAYLNGETLKENLQRRGYIDDTSYLMTPYFYVDSNTDGWYSKDCAPLGEEKNSELDWLKQLRELYADLEDDAVLVSVDVHN